MGHPAWLGLLEDPVLWIRAPLSPLLGRKLVMKVVHTGKVIKVVEEVPYSSGTHCPHKGICYSGEDLGGGAEPKWECPVVIYHSLPLQSQQVMVIGVNMDPPVSTAEVHFGHECSAC